MGAGVMVWQEKALAAQPELPSSISEVQDNDGSIEDHDLYSPPHVYTNK